MDDVTISDWVNMIMVILVCLAWMALMYGLFRGAIYIAERITKKL